MMGRRVTTCRSCGSSNLHEVLDLGETPIANALVDASVASATDNHYPLGLMFCSACSLVQLTFELPAEAIFGDDYPYYSSFSDELCRHAAEHVHQLLATVPLDST